MDLATLVGLIGALAVLGLAVFFGGSANIFLNIPSILIVLAGTIMVVLIKFNLKQTLGAMKVAGHAFSNKLQPPQELIAELLEMTSMAQREGILALENVSISNDFLQRGVNLLIDGNKSEEIRTMLQVDLRETVDRHTWGAKVFGAIGDVAPAMGMIGTLIGLVQMLSSMDDPKKIGPAMAVALLTTLYGAVLANVVAMPIADKLALRKAEEKKLNQICLEGVLAIGEGHNPRVLEAILKTYLPPADRDLEGIQPGGAEVEQPA